MENELETLSLIDRTKDIFKLYPNPVSELLKFSSSNLREADLRITDMTGKVVYNNALDLHEGLDVSHLNNGIYILTVNQTSNHRFVKI